VIDVQPTALVGGSAAYNTISTYIGIAAAGGVVCLLIAYLLLRKTSSGAEALSKLDILYSNKHPFGTMLDQKPFAEDQMWRVLYVKEWKTPEGGFFSILFVICAIAVALLLFLPYQFDNTMETASLIPASAVDTIQRQSVAFDATITLSLYNFEPNCVKDPVSSVDSAGNVVTVGKCLSSVAVSSSLSALQSVNSSAAASIEYTRCLYRIATASAPAMCQVTWTRSKSIMPLQQAFVYFNFTDPMAFASSIGYQLTTTSGIADQNSTVGSYLSSPSGFAYRGISPTIVGIGVTSTIFNTTVSGETPSTGLRNQIASQTGGSTVSYNTFQTTSDLSFVMSFTRTDQIYLVNHIAKLSLVASLSQVSGALSGLLGGIGAAMAVFEVLFFASKFTPYDKEHCTSLDHDGDSTPKELKLTANPLAEPPMPAVLSSDIELAIARPPQLTTLPPTINSSDVSFSRQNSNLGQLQAGIPPAAVNSIRTTSGRMVSMTPKSAVARLTEAARMRAVRASSTEQR
jgi:hypothetical protein